MAVTVWIAKWSRQSEEEQKKTRYLLVLVLLTVAAVVVSLLRAVVTFISLVRVRFEYCENVSRWYPVTCPKRK